MYCKICGKLIDDDSKFCSHCGASLRSISNNPNDTIKSYAIVQNEPSDDDIIPVLPDLVAIKNPELTPGLMLSAILFFLFAGYWLMLGSMQTAVSGFFESSRVGVIGLWNILVACGFVVIGIGIIKLKKWGYEWGTGSTFLNVIFSLYFYLKSEQIFQLFLWIAILNVVALLLLYFDRANFILKPAQNIVANKGVVFVSRGLSNDIRIIKKSIETYNDSLLSDDYLIINEILKKHCVDKESSEQFLKTYRDLFNCEFIDDVKNMTTSLQVIKETLSPFIEFNIIQNRYPFETLNVQK